MLEKKKLLANVKMLETFISKIFGTMVSLNYFILVVVNKHERKNIHPKCGNVIDFSYD